MEVPLPPGGNIPVDPGPPGLPPPPVGGGGLPGPVDGELLFLPDPEAGVLNHGVGGPVPPVVGPPPIDINNQAAANQNPPMLKNAESLEDLCIMTYLKYLESEVVTYISLTQSKSRILKGVAKRMLKILKNDIKYRITGIASSSIREKMVTMILSDKFPSEENCNIYTDTKDESADSVESEEIVIPTCPNICCTGAFVQEAMMGIIMCSEIRQLIFTKEKVRSRRHIPHGSLEFNVPVVLTHLLGATDGKVSQLERLVFSEGFVKEEPENETTKICKKNLPRLDQTDKQQAFAKNFGMGNIYDTPDRRGIVVDLIVLFRDIHPKGLKYHKLTELILKNNIQCKIYSRADFQFEFLARIGFCCPRLRVFDVYGTDTWADCLIALFLKDAFHSLHRYLFFMENEEDECSEYHPHDTTRYCQFCLDQWHPNQIERPYTNNPVIPLLDSVYNHVIKRYPKRSYLILRNCVCVSDLIKCTQSSVFELVRPERAPICKRCTSSKTMDADPLSSTSSSVEGIKSRLRSCRRTSQSLKQRMPFTSTEAANLSSHKLAKLNEPSTGPGSGEPRQTGYRRSARLNPNYGGLMGPTSSCTEDSLSLSAAGALRLESPDDNILQQPDINQRESMREMLTTTFKAAKQLRIGFPSKGHQRNSGYQEAGTSSSCLTGASSSSSHGEVSATRVIMTRALKRKLDSHSDINQGIVTRSGTSISSASKIPKLDRSQQQSPLLHPQQQLSNNQPPLSFERRLLGVGRSRREEAASLVADNMNISSANSCADWEQLDDSVIQYHDWWKERDKLETKYPPSVCREGELSGAAYCDQHEIWFEPKVIKYREIDQWPHMNECVKTLEVLNIGSSNVLGEFLPFLFLRVPRLRSLGQWLNTMIYGLEILRDLPGYQNYVNYQLQEFSYSSDRSYYCQPYIGFVPETQDFKNVRKEMAKYSNRSATKVGHKSRYQSAKRNQIMDDIDLMVNACPNLKKVNLVIHYTFPMMDNIHTQVWEPLLKLKNLVELDLIVMKFQNVKSLLTVIGSQLEKLTIECDEEQGNGSEIVHIARSCPNLVNLRILVGEKVLRGEMTLHFGQNFFRKLEHLEVEGNIHLHGFAFLWGHCQNIKYIRIGLVVSNEVTSTNVLIQDVFTLLFQVNKMSHLEELHIKNLKIRTLNMGIFLLDNLPNLKKASNWLLDLPWPEVVIFNRHLKGVKNQGLKLDYDRL